MRILVSMARTQIRDTFIPGDVQELIESLAGGASWNTLAREYTRDELRDALEGVDACLCGWYTPPFDADTLAKADGLSVIAYTGGSLDGVVSPAVFDRGITVVGGNYAFGESVAEGALCYMLAALRDIPRCMALTRGGGWRGAQFKNRGLLDRVVGIIGFGAAGSALAAMLGPFRARVVVCDPYADPAGLPPYARMATLDELCAQADVISVHAAKTPETFHMIGRKQLALMKDGCVLVNTALGSLIDEAALVEALATRPLFAALDVTEPEPPAGDSPLRSLPNVILMPHMAGPTVDRRPHITRALIEDIVSIREGREPRNSISRERAAAMSQG
jgi:phosphoglycerate dehydrogenase-like enzyme